MSHYVKANGKSVHASRGVPIDGWYLVKGKKAHLFFEDGTTGCRATVQDWSKVDGYSLTYPRCAFCEDVDARYKRDAGVELYDALEAVLKDWNGETINNAQRALALGRNRKA